MILFIGTFGLFIASVNTPFLVNAKQEQYNGTPVYLGLTPIFNDTATFSVITNTNQIFVIERNSALGIENIKQVSLPVSLPNGSQYSTALALKINEGFYLFLIEKTPVASNYYPAHLIFYQNNQLINYLNIEIQDEGQNERLFWFGGLILLGYSNDSSYIFSEIDQQSLKLTTILDTKVYLNATSASFIDMDVTYNKGVLAVNTITTSPIESYSSIILFQEAYINKPVLQVTEIYNYPTGIKFVSLFGNILLGWTTNVTYITDTETNSQNFNPTIFSYSDPKEVALISSNEYVAITNAQIFVVEIQPFEQFNLTTTLRDQKPIEARSWQMTDLYKWDNEFAFGYLDNGNITTSFTSINNFFPQLGINGLNIPITSSSATSTVIIGFDYFLPILIAVILLGLGFLAYEFNKRNTKSRASYLRDSLSKKEITDQYGEPSAKYFVNENPPKTNKKLCSNCGAVINSDDKFCFACGSDQP